MARYTVRDPEFIASIVKRMNDGEKIDSLASEVGVSAQTLHLWRKKVESVDSPQSTEGTETTSTSENSATPAGVASTVNNTPTIKRSYTKHIGIQNNQSSQELIRLREENRMLKQLLKQYL